MPLIKSREAECPESLLIALVNLEIAKDNLYKLARVLRHQSGLFNTDVVSTILDETADEIETHIPSMDALKEELSDFLSNQN